MPRPPVALSITALSRRMVRELHASATRDGAITLGGHLARFALGFGASVLIARTLGAEGYGLIALLALALAVADSLGDFGLTYTAVRAISRAVGPEPEQARWLVRGYFSLGFVTNALTAVAAIALAEPIAEHIFGRPDAALYLRLVFLGLFTVAGTGFTTTVLHSLRHFKQLAGIQIFAACTYLAGIVALWATGRLTVATVVLLGALNPILAFVVGVRLLPPGLFALRTVFARPALQAWKELAGFGKWLWLSSILSLLASQLDLLLLARWAPAAAVGLYALAFNLAMKLDIVNQSRLTVLLPTVAALQSGGEMRRFAMRSLKRSALLVAGFVLLAPLFPWFISTFYGPDFAGAVPTLLLLGIVVLFDLVTTPLLLLGFPLNQPHAFAMSDVVRVAALLLAGALLIPSLGPIGAALSRLASHLAGTGFMLAVIMLRLRHPKESTPAPRASAQGF